MNALLGPTDEDGRIPRAAADPRRGFSDVRAWRAGAPARDHDADATAAAVACRVARPILPGDGNPFVAHARDAWVPDPQLALPAWQWETAWLPRPMKGAADHFHGLLVDMAALGHAIHAGIRPAALLPESVAAIDPFVLAMRRIEFESGRLLQAQILFLKGPQLIDVRNEVADAVERATIRCASSGRRCSRA